MEVQQAMTTPELKTLIAEAEALDNEIRIMIIEDDLSGSWEIIYKSRRLLPQLVSVIKELMDPDKEEKDGTVQASGLRR